MTTSSPIIFILGAGPNIGRSLIRLFTSKGYKVALAARSIRETESSENQLNIKSDFSKPDEVVRAFTKVRETIGIPSVVVYNCSAGTFTPSDEPLALSPTDFERDTNINIHSAFVAAQQAVLGFAQLSDSAARTFIYTGNVLNVSILPRFLSAGVGKSGAAHMIWASSAAYKHRGFKFYYADERTQDGSPKFQIDGDAHAELYWELAITKTQGPWMQTFVKDVGYTKFETLYTPLA